MISTEAIEHGHQKDIPVDVVQQMSGFPKEQQTVLISSENGTQDTAERDSRLGLREGGHRVREAQ